MTAPTDTKRERTVRAASGEALLRTLEWDTDFFGALMGEVARVAPLGRRQGALTDILRTAAGEARDQGFQHLITRCDAADWDFIRAAEAAGWRLVDVGIDFARTPAATAGANVNATRPARPDDLAWAAAFGSGAFTHSRFAADPFFSDEQARAFHRAWVSNLWSGLAQHVIVAEAARGPAGFVACGLNGGNGRIILIATEPGARRAGVGRALVDAALGWFATEGATVARVKTQASNVPALALYERAGFTVERSELTYSWTPFGDGATR